MKKNLVILVAATLMLASCGTYAGAGAGQGAWLGGLIGSCIGGINGGPRGHDVGTLLGMAGGAVVGAAIGSAADNQRESDMEQYQAEKARLAANRRARQQARQTTTTTTTTGDYNYEQGAQQDSGFDSTNSGDDRIELDLSDNTTTSVSVDSLSKIEPITEANGTPNVQIRNARFVDENGDNIISRGEQCTIVFEIFNSGTASAYNLQPTVLETTGNKHILVSPSILIESLAAGKGVRYTARIVADKSLKAGNAQFSVAVVQGTETITKVMNFTVQTAK